MRRTYYVAWISLLLVAAAILGGCSQRDTYLLKWRESVSSDWVRYSISGREGVEAVEQWLADNADAVDASRPMVSLLAIDPDWYLYSITAGGRAQFIPVFEYLPVDFTTPRADVEWKVNLPSSEVERLKGISTKFGTRTDYDPDAASVR